MPKNFLLIMFVIFFHITGLLETPTFSEKQKKNIFMFLNHSATTSARENFRSSADDCAAD